MTGRANRSPTGSATAATPDAVPAARLPSLGEALHPGHPAATANGARLPVEAIPLRLRVGRRWANSPWLARPWGPVRLLQAALLVVFLLGMGAENPTLRAWLDAGVYSAVQLCTATLAALTALRAADLREARAWWLLAAATGTAGAADCYLSLTGAFSASLRPGSLIDVAYALLFPAVYACAWLLLRARAPRWSPSLFWDGLVVVAGAVALAATCLYLAFPEAFGDRTTTVMAVAYPMAGAVLAAELAWMSSVSRGDTRAVTAWLSAGCAILAASALWCLAEGLAGGYEEGGVLDVGYLVGAVALGAATRGGQPGADRERRQVRVAAWQRLGLPALLLLTSLAILGGAVLSTDVGPVGALAALVCLATALVRLVAANGLLDRGTWPLPTPEGPSPFASRRTRDEVTGLANRNAVVTALATPRRSGPPLGDDADEVSLLVVDLDRFKEVNEALGHPAGDRLLGLVGQRLLCALRPQQLLARLGGDEFAVILTGAGSGAARRVAHGLRSALEEPFVVDGEPVHVRASVGIATTASPQRTLRADLLRQADVAMYRAKRSTEKVVVYDPALDSPAGPGRLRLIDDLSWALAHGELEVHLQPQVRLDSGILVGAEALARWDHPEHGLLLPETFLPVAYESGLRAPLTRLLVDRALDACRQWWTAGHAVPVSVNLTADDLADPATQEHVTTALAVRGLPGRALQVEITEQVLLTEPAETATLLAGWRRLGVRVSIDDYGTGYSSLAYLAELPVDEVKLDRVFARDLRRRTTATIVRHTVELAHALELSVVAEGVEDAGSARTLTLLGCDVGQGTYFAGAMSVPDFLTMVTGR